MKILATAIVVSVGLLGMTACEDDYARPAGYYGHPAAYDVGPAPIAYDGYYDDFYGPFSDGYWGEDGFFYYSDGGGHFRRDVDHHFRHDAVEGFHPVHGQMHDGRRP